MQSKTKSLLTQFCLKISPWQGNMAAERERAALNKHRYDRDKSVLICDPNLYRLLDLAKHAIQDCLHFVAGTLMAHLLVFALVLNKTCLVVKYHLQAYTIIYTE